MLKKALLLAALTVCSSAFANGSGAGAGGTQDTTVTTTSGADASNAGNNQSITVNIPAAEQKDLTRTIVDQNVSGTQTVKNVPSVSGPPLTSSNDTCMGSSSGSVNVPGFGASLGSTWTDDNCRMLKNSRELWNMGMKAAALALMCTDAGNREALELTGFACPQRRAGERTGQSDGERYTDPIVRARLGLPPLK